MSYPLSSGKYTEPSATNPSLFYEEDDAIPRSAIMCFQPPVYEYAKETYDGNLLNPNHPRYRLYLLEQPDGSVGAVGDLGIGGPATARVIEELIARGVSTLTIIGHAGGLQQDIDLGDIVVVNEALRDEGTSYHYLEPSRTITASESIWKTLQKYLERNGETVHVGETWTIDAMFRQTKPEVEQHAADGVLTVDMEAASAFAVAKYRDVQAGAAFIVSDYVGPDNWEVQNLSETWPHLKRLFDTTVEAIGNGS